MIPPLIIVIYLQVMANLQLPNYMAQIINEGILAEDMNRIYAYGGAMLLITFGGSLAAITTGYLVARIASGFTRDIRKKVFERVESFSAGDINKFSVSSLLTRTTNDVQQAHTAMTMILRPVIMAPMMAIGALQNALVNAPGLSWIIALSVAILLATIALIFTLAVPKFKILQTTTDRLNLVTRENLTGLRVVRAFNNEATQEDKFDAVNKDLVALNLFVNRLMIVMFPFMTLLMNVALVAIIWFGAQLISDFRLEIGNMMAFMQYATQVMMSFLMLSVVFIMLPRASVSAKRIREVIDAAPTIVDPPKPQKIPKNSPGRVEFQNVSFKFPDADTAAISNISFTAEPGKKTAIIGSTGSGKSTLINLIPRFYDVSSGKVSIDGVDVRNLKLEDLYRQIGYIPQKSVLFSGTIKSNVAYGNHRAPEKDIVWAIKTAQASQFVNNLTKGIHSPVSQGGANVSGGQKQRLSIARALAVKPKIYLFDDSFSALDFKTDTQLRKDLKKEIKDSTVIVVAQRIGTILDADKIIVLNEGKVVGEGTHQELLKTNQVYQEIAHSQLSDSELSLHLETANGVNHG